MKLKPKAALTIRPDANGHYPDAVALRLVEFGLAEPLTDQDKGTAKNRRNRKRR